MKFCFRRKEMSEGENNREKTKNIFQKLWKQLNAVH